MCVCVCVSNWTVDCINGAATTATTRDMNEEIERMGKINIENVFPPFCVHI